MITSIVADFIKTGLGLDKIDYGLITIPESKKRGVRINLIRVEKSGETNNSLNMFINEYKVQYYETTKSGYFDKLDEMVNKITNLDDFEIDFTSLSDYKIEEAKVVEINPLTYNNDFDGLIFIEFVFLVKYSKIIGG